MLVVTFAVWGAPRSAQAGQDDLAAPCVVQGRVTTGSVPLPGVSFEAVPETGRVTHETVSRPDGTYRLTVAGAGLYRMRLRLPGFLAVSREVRLDGRCQADVDFDLALGDATPPGPVVTGATEWNPADQAAAEALGLPAAVVMRPGAALAEFAGRTFRPDRAWLADRRRLTASPASSPAPTAADAAAVRPPAGQKPAAARPPAATVRVPVPPQAYQGTVSYGLNGSAFDSAPFQLRPGTPVQQRPYTRQTFGLSLGGPVRVPHLYDGGRRTTFALTYSGNRGSSLFDQYATVPTDAVRAGDFSAAPAPLIDPDTGAPFPAQRIPPERVHPAARSLLPYIPAANLPGTSRNFQYTTTTHSTSNNITLKLVHQFTAPQPAGRAPAGARTVGSVTAQLQIRQSAGEQANVFPSLGGATRNRTVAVPVTVTLQRGKHQHALKLDVSSSLARAESRFAFVTDVAAEAGIAGLAREPFTWGVPVLSFATYSSTRDLEPTRRHDRRLSLGYGWTHTAGRHSLSAGADTRFDWSDNQTDANARGSFVFTGRHTAGSTRVPRGAGFDFADFLLGLPQQATVQFGPGQVHLRGRVLGLYVQDDFRRSPALTLTLGLRYDVVWPLLEADRQMVNLDASPDFTAVAPVVSGDPGPITGAFPPALIELDADNLAPRVAIAWKGPRALTLRSGYGVTFNAGSYSTIARKLVSQPPFAASQENLGTLAAPLDLADPFQGAAITEGATTFGVDRDYTIGAVQTWNAELSRPFRTVWTASAGYTGKRGSSLDLLRTPNRDPGASDFQWQSAVGRSAMHGLTLRLQRRKARGLGGGATYSLARSRDNMAVAQNDSDLDAEWSLSSFDVRHQLSCDLNVDLPFGPGRRWLTRGRWSPLVAAWSASATLTAQSGTPLTPRVTGARAANRPLRPDLTGEPVRLPSPTIDVFFNTAAFALPEPGRFGTAGRNSIIGPGSRLLNASIARDVRLGGSRVLTARLDVNNLLNLVNYSAVNTTVNSSAFGQVTSVRPMRTMTLSFQVRY